MLGLGMYSTRFSDGNTGIQYDGGSIGGGIDLVPHDRQGFYGSVHFHKLNIKRTMLAHNYLPLTRLNENSIQGAWGWKRSAPGHQQGIQLEGLYHKRKGTLSTEKAVVAIIRKSTIWNNTATKYMPCC